ncbi:hypothetical protein, partial [Xanthomonas translucens]|uniref:hypothetical protein n=1 Tax=Xanthomonas campestris pv. translucens TaxID=343 RepID=UPI0035EE16DD
MTAPAVHDDALLLIGGRYMDRRDFLRQGLAVGAVAGVDALAGGIAAPAKAAPPAPAAPRLQPL